MRFLARVMREMGMLKRSVLLTTAFLALSPMGAEAQWYGPYHGYHGGYHGGFFRPNVYRPPVVHDELTPREIVNALQARGFRNIGRPAYGEETAAVVATDPGGQRVRVRVDLYSGAIVDRRRLPQVAQRAPDQGAAIRRAVPDPVERTRATPPEVQERGRATPDKPTVIRREPLLPPQTTTPAPPRNNRVVQPERPAPAAKPPEASVGSGTRNQPRRIDIITPPAPLDAPPDRPVAPAGPPLNSVPPAGLE
jgi:hypothetical protein